MERGGDGVGNLRGRGGAEVQDAGCGGWNARARVRAAAGQKWHKKQRWGGGGCQSRQTDIYYRKTV